ncbi:MAG: hypothetical protein ABI831_15850 [Betaproteobacteria bacterium]
MSAPYAIAARNAQFLGGLAASGYIHYDDDGNVGIGPDGTLYGYLVPGGSPGPYPTLGLNTYSSAYLAGMPGYGGLFQFQNGDGKLAYYSGSNAQTAFPHTLTQRLSIMNDGRVNIGSVSGSAKLNVFGGTGVGTYSESTTGSGVQGYSPSGIGVRGDGFTGSGIFGMSSAASLTAGGVYGKGLASGSIGVIGEANINNAVGLYGASTSPTGFGMYARNTAGTAILAEGHARQSFDHGGAVCCTTKRSVQFKLPPSVRRPSAPADRRRPAANWRSRGGGRLPVCPGALRSRA